MKKLYTLFLILISFSLFAEECDCPGSPLDEENKQTIELGKRAAEILIKKRQPPNGQVLLALETNFKVPFIGKDNYFATLYTKSGVQDQVRFRDELIAESSLEEEKTDEKKFYYSEFAVTQINNPSGLELIKKAGAEVTVKSNGNFSLTTGGRLFVKVKAPRDRPIDLVLDAEVENGKMKNFLVLNGQRIPFDSMVINAEKGMMGGPSILSGIQNIQFISSGKTIKSLSE